jgi:ABC-type transport system involved in multi-copper enzyme maturation permease subunit
MWKTFFFRILILALLVFLMAYYVLVYINTTRIVDVIKPLKDDIQRTELAIEGDKIALENAEDSEVRGIEDSLEFNESWLEERQAEVEVLEEENWDAFLQMEIEDTEPHIDRMRYENQTHTYSHPTLFTLETYVEMSKWMQEKNVTPLLPMNRYFYYVTFYDQEVNSTSRTEADSIMNYIRENSNNKYSSTSMHYLFRLFGILFSLIGVVFFLFIFGDIVTKEGLGQNGPIHLLKTQPIRHYKIIASKFLTVILSSFFLLLSAVVFSIMVGGIFDRFGDWHYPVLIYGQDRTFTLMSMGVFLVKATAMFMLILLFSYSILFLFSILTKRVLVAIGLTIGTLIVGMRLGGELLTSSVSQYIPFQYFSVFEVLTNELALTSDNFNLTYMNGITSLGMVSFVLLVITYGLSIVQSKKGN